MIIDTKGPCTAEFSHFAQQQRPNVELGKGLYSYICLSGYLKIIKWKMYMIGARTLMSGSYVVVSCVKYNN